MASESKTSHQEKEAVEDEAYEFADVEDYATKLLKRVCSHVLKEKSYDHSEARELADRISALVMERMRRKGSNLKVVLHTTVFQGGSGAGVHDATSSYIDASSDGVIEYVHTSNPEVHASVTAMILAV